MPLIHHLITERIEHLSRKDGDGKGEEVSHSLEFLQSLFKWLPYDVIHDWVTKNGQSEHIKKQVARHSGIHDNL